MNATINRLAACPGLVYLASPYSDPDPAVREQRFQAVCRAAAHLMRRGVLVFSPIAHTHPIALCGLPGGWEFWQKYDRVVLEACKAVAVLMLDGWDASKGIWGEVEIAGRLGLPVVYLDPGETL